MKILSIDVGMKNLAYCLFNISDDLRYSIEKWEVLNLCNSENIICMGFKKDKSKCDKKAKYCKNLKAYCKNHAKNKGFKIPSNDINIKKIAKLKFTLLKQFADKYSISYDKKNKKTELFEIVKTHINENYFEFVSKKRTQDFNLVEYGRELKKQFTETLKDIQIDGVIVENQIGPLALRMKTLQGMIMQHFIERNIPLVEEVSATNKLKEFLGTQKTTYNERKKMSIGFTRDILVKENLLTKWCDFFDSHKKKDDLADCFLQGRWYLNKTLLKK